MAKLTAKQELFIKALIKGKTQREAYITAYPKSKSWTENAIDSRASRLLKSDKVLTRYNELHERVIKEAENECIITAKEVLLELKRIGFADIKDFISFRTEKTVVSQDKATGAPIIDYSPIIEMLPSEQVDGKAISEVSVNSKGIFSFKLHDKMSALDKLARHLGMFTEKVEITGAIPVVIAEDLGDEDEEND